MFAFTHQATVVVLMVLCSNAGASVMHRSALAGRGEDARKLKPEDFDKCLRDVPCVARDASKEKYDPENCKVAAASWRPIDGADYIETVGASTLMGPYIDKGDPDSNCEIWLTNQSRDKGLEYNRKDMADAIDRLVHQCKDSDLVAIECDLVDDDDTSISVRLEIYARDKDAASTKTGDSLSSLGPSGSSRR